MVPKGSWWRAAGGSCDIGERREVCSDKHLSGHRVRAGQAPCHHVGDGSGARGWLSQIIRVVWMQTPASDALLLLSEPLGLL